MKPARVLKIEYYLDELNDAIKNENVVIEESRHNFDELALKTIIDNELDFVLYGIQDKSGVIHIFDFGMIEMLNEKLKKLKGIKRKIFKLRKISVNYFDESDYNIVKSIAL